jgi:hypothetical protein
MRTDDEELKWKIKEGVEVFRGLHVLEFLNFQVQKYTGCTRGSRNGNYGSTSHNPCSERYQAGGPIRAPCREMKLNPGDGYASQLINSFSHIFIYYSSTDISTKVLRVLHSLLQAQATSGLHY